MRLVVILKILHNEICQHWENLNAINQYFPNDDSMLLQKSFTGKTSIQNTREGAGVVAEQ